MANYKQHLQFGIISSTIGSLVGYFAFQLTPIESGAALTIGVLASLAPDFDHPISTPGDLLCTWLGIIVPVGICLKFSDTQKLQLEHWITGLAIGYFFIKNFTSFLLDKLTVHRGMFHSLPAIFICGECIFLFFGHLSIQPRLTITIIAMSGYLTHLLADEIYSVDWNGKEISLKKSAGTALDLGSITKFPTWVCYFLLGLLSYLSWHNGLSQLFN